MKLKAFFVWLVIIICGALACMWTVQNVLKSSYEYGSFQENYSSNLKFNIYQNSILLVEDKAQPNKYAYSTTFSSAYQVCPDYDATKKVYEMQLNGQIFATSTIEYGYADLNLNFTFLNTHGEELLTDTLYIALDFNFGSTSLTIYTLGGSQAVEYWNYFFDSAGFTLRVYEVGEKTVQKEDAALAASYKIVYDAVTGQSAIA